VLSDDSALNDLDQTPGLRFGNRPAFGDCHYIPFLALIVFIVRMKFAGTADVFSI
jgi:hypothetical protein